MSPRRAVAGGLLVALCAGAAGVVAWRAREAPVAPPPSAAAAAAAAPGEAAEMPREPEARERALEANEAAALFLGLRSGFDAAARTRTPASEARLLPALDALFPGRTPPSTIECRRLVCRIEVAAPAAEWRDRLAADPEVRRHAERMAFDPDGGPVALLELVPVRVADGPRPEGERLLLELERALLDSEAARGCVAEGQAPREAEVRLLVDQSGVTFRFGAAVDSRVAYCLMTQAMPDVLASASAPAGVRRAERKVRVRAP